jgi:two-component system, probable response regulator PhcQ
MAKKNLTLRNRSRQMDRIPKESRHADPGSKKRILVVDDQRSILDLLREVLSREPYEVVCAGSAEEALQILEHSPADVIISDERMPGMSGTRFLSIARRKYPETIRIILTGYATLEAAIKAINEGEIYRFFRKPCNVTDLVITIRQALHQRKLQQENLKLVEIIRRQQTSINQMEKRYPGISRVRTDVDGAVIIDDE